MLLTGISKTLNETLGSHTAAMEFFWKAKKEKEALGLSLFRKENIYFELGTREFMSCEVVPYFTKHLWKGEVESVQDFLEFERFPKTVWLAREFLKSGKFNNPIGVIWDPFYDYAGFEDEWPPIRDQGVWRIHPGGSRQTIYYYFLDKEKTFEAVTYATTGKPTPYPMHKIFQNPEELIAYYRSKIKVSESTLPFYMEIVPDKGTLIPHILTDSKTNHTNGMMEHNRIFRHYSNNRFIFNFAVGQDILGVKEQALENTIKITIKDPDDSFLQTKAMIISAFPTDELKTYKCDNITVEVQ